MSKEQPKVSLTILSYRQPELTNGLISSFFHNGPNYPNYEIIVVDNASPRSDVNQIKSFVKKNKYKNIRFIENRENLGFAGGNNKGLNASNGDYILMLNNDTCLTPGCIKSLVKHLENDQSIGAVGPLTNNIGNEARVEVTYPNFNEMLIQARDLTTGYRGKAPQ